MVNQWNKRWIWWARLTDIMLWRKQQYNSGIGGSKVGRGVAGDQRNGTPNSKSTGHWNHNIQVMFLVMWSATKCKCMFVWINI